MRQLIQLKGLSKNYGKQTVLNPLNLSIAQGEFLTLLGPSGSGKSTTLMMLAGLIKPSSGHIELDGQDITGLPAEMRNFGVVFQGYALFPHMTVAQNVAYPLRLRKRPATEVKQRVATLLQRVGLADLAALPNFPADNSNGRHWRGRWSLTPNCCCWMSRFQRWTGVCGKRCKKS